MSTTFTKDPDAVLDYAFDWTDWLADGEGITSHDVNITGDDTVNLDSSSETNGVVTVWTSGGTVPNHARVTCHIVTDQGREDDRTIILKVQDR